MTTGAACIIMAWAFILGHDPTSSVIIMGGPDAGERCWQKVEKYRDHGDARCEPICELRFTD